MPKLAKKPYHMAAHDSNAAKNSVRPLTTAEAVDRVWTILNGKKYDWRSANGIAKEAQLDQFLVVSILEHQLADRIVRSVDKNHPGEYLYATRERYNEIRGPWNRVLSAITNQVR